MNRFISSTVRISESLSCVVGISELLDFVSSVARVSESLHLECSGYL